MRAEQFDRAIGDWAAALPHPRFSVYRNNVVSALINALRVRYPVIEQLVGPAFFTEMAGQFTRCNRPRSPMLIGYGEDFPDFVRGFQPSSPVPYLSDVARLESLWWCAYHAADMAPLQSGSFAAVAPDAWADMRFMFHPSTALLASRFAIASIWEAHHGGPPMPMISTNEAQCVLVARPFAQVELRRISAQAHDFLTALHGGATLGDAVQRMSMVHENFDLTQHLSALIGHNIITGFSA